MELSFKLHSHVWGVLLLFKALSHFVSYKDFAQIDGRGRVTLSLHSQWNLLENPFYVVASNVFQNPATYMHCEPTRTRMNQLPNRN